MRKCLLVFLLFFSIKSLGQTLEADRLALAAIYNNFSGQFYPELANWVVPGSPGDSPCGWYGITCSGGRVTALDLKHLGIRGTLAPEVGNLTALTTLDLSGLGEELGAWTGELPVEVGNLTNLEYLYLGENRFGITNMAVIGNLTRLKELSVTPLGEIPSEWASLVDLEVLFLGSREAFAPSETFTFPAFLTGFTKLRALYLIQQFKGTFPSQIGSLANLETLEVSGNYSLTGQILPEIGNLSKLKKLLMLRNENMNGPIPVEIGNLTNLEELWLGDTPYTGSLPAQINNLTKLKLIIIGSTNLGGPFPAINNLIALSTLDIRYNHFQGPLPSLANIPVSGLANISSNAFTFAGLEENISKLDGYLSQANVPITVQLVPGDAAQLTVEVGGTLLNNTYKWYKNGVLFATNVGNKSITVTEQASYRVEVTNSVVAGLKLVSNNYSHVILPVTLISFNGERNGVQNKLTWQTSSEISNKGFEIERSRDARTFEKIGFVDGNGDTKERNTYHFTDLTPPATSYYRLKQLDYDGKSEYSKIIVVKAQQPQLSIYPNPAQNNITIAGYEGNPQVSVFSQTGKLVLQHQIDTGHLPLESLKNGIYTIQIGNDSKKLLIQR